MQYGPAQGVRRAAFTIAVEAAYPLMFGRHSSRLSVRMRTLYRITAAREAGAAFGKGKHIQKWHNVVIGQSADSTQLLCAESFFELTAILLTFFKSKSALGGG